MGEDDGTGTGAGAGFGVGEAGPEGRGAEVDKYAGTCACSG